MRGCRLVATAAILVAVPLVGSAQAPADGTVRGIVHVAGAPLRGVRVLAERDEAGWSREVRTGDAGTYLLDVPAGRYTLTFEAVRFDRVVRSLVVHAGATVLLDVALTGRWRAPAVASAPLSSGEERAAWWSNASGALLSRVAITAETVGRATGSNRFRGVLRASLTDHRLQWDNITDTLRAQGAGLGSRTRRAAEATLEGAGPIRPGHAWFHASVTRRDSDVGIVGFYVPACLGVDGLPAAGADRRADCLEGDRTSVTEVTARLDQQWNARHRTTVVWGRTDKRKPWRGASARTRPEATNRQRELGLAQPFDVQHEWVASPRLLLAARYTFDDASFILDFQEPGLAVVQPAYDRYTLTAWRSGVQREFVRPSRDARATGTWTGKGRSGAHVVKFGVAREEGRDREATKTGGGAVAVFDSRSGELRAYQARIVRDGLVDLLTVGWSMFVEDSYRRGRLSVNAGVRYDRQDDRALPGTIAGNPLLPDLLPAVSFAGADSGVTYQDWSPRVGVSWDLTRSGGTIVSGSVRRYAGSGNRTSGVLQPTGPTRLTWWWTDGNGNGLVEAGELDRARGLAGRPTPNYDPAVPAAVRTPARVDPSLRNDRTEEVAMTLDQRLSKAVTLRVGFTWRKYHRLQDVFPMEADGSPVASETFVPVAWSPAGCHSDAQCPEVIYYQRAQRLPAATILRNTGQRRYHERLDLEVHKRAGGGWSLSAGAAWNRGVRWYSRPTRDYSDPTNIVMWNGHEYSPREARWEARLSATARLPWGVEAALLAAARQGFPYTRVVSSPARGALGSTQVHIKPFGAERYPGVHTFDARLGRTCRAGRVRVEPTVTIFNLLNSNVVLGRNRVQNSRSSNDVTDVMEPRSLRLDLALAW